jgi:hypothetical protein
VGNRTATVQVARSGGQAHTITRTYGYRCMCMSSDKSRSLKIRE